MRHLDGPDLFHLAQERPDRPMHTVKVAVLGRRLERAAIDRWAAEVLPSIEPLRLRLAGPPLARPVWIDGGDPDLGHHVGHLSIDEPGGEAELSAALARLCAGELDRRRPLWRLWHLTGLAGDRDALAFQVHHAVADGDGSVSLWEAIADGAIRPAPPVDSTPSPAPSPQRSSPAERASSSACPAR